VVNPTVEAKPLPLYVSMPERNILELGYFIDYF
jgi:hypothetical protein